MKDITTQLFPMRHRKLPKGDIFPCSLKGCDRPASHHWDYRQKHFCSEKHLIKWVHEKLTSEDDPYSKGGD